MKEIGEYLKETRTKNGVSIEEASEDLNISIVELENLEDGNIRAFRDVYDLKELVREYSKYLGIDTDKILDEFNDFMFEHTSKISLSDIEEARRISKEMDEKPKVVSPYTYVRKKKFDLKKIKWKKILLVICAILIVLLVIILFKSLTKKGDNISTELMGRMSDICEFSY